jgi:hypothetical protein
MAEGTGRAGSGRGAQDAPAPELELAAAEISPAPKRRLDPAG